MAQIIQVPDIGDYKDVVIIEIAKQVGDNVEVDDTLITLETDKATMDIPATLAGKVSKLLVKVGDKVSKGDSIMEIEVEGVTVTVDDKPKSEPVAPPPAAVKPEEIEDAVERPHVESHASPAVRRMGNEFGVDLSSIEGTGRKGRVIKEDVVNYIRNNVNSNNRDSSSLINLAPSLQPNIDFSKYGDIEIRPLSRIKKISGAHLHRNWVSIPHVTQFDEAEIDDLESFRVQNKQVVEAQGAKFTILVFIMKALVACLKKFPNFNASLDNTQENLICKNYFNIGVAVDTPNGLVVPVVRDVDKKSLIQLSLEIAELSKKARDGKLSAQDMQGGNFSISSLGGISGTFFTPIINAPEVAILGISKMRKQLKLIDGQVKEVSILPLSLSYDHRVIDGAEAARFTKYLTEVLHDFRRVML